MSAITDKAYHYRTIRKTAYSANIIYLLVRLFYIILFLVSKFYIMAYITAGTMLFYFLFFLVIKKKKYYLYALLCGNEYFAYVIVATWFLGFNSGFCFYLIGLCVVSFFTTYFSKDRNFRGTVVWAILSLAIFLTMYFTSQGRETLYVPAKWLEMTLFTTHAVGVFAFIVLYLLVFMNYAFSLEKKITNESRTDELTQINNRYGLYDYFDYENDKESLYLALFDIDDFKTINDTYGHVTGDFVLKRVAEITSKTLEDSFVCRYGGEEFVVVIRNEDANPYYDKLETLRKNIEKETFEFNDLKIKITITIGAVKFVKGLTIEKWVQLADERMYAGKNSGKNKTVI